MGKKAQTRIVASVNGEVRRLLSITEKPSGQLTITGGLEAYALNEKGVPTHLIVQDKTTVHVSREAGDGGNQIHHSCIFQDLPRVDTYHYTLGVKNGLVVPIYIQVLVPLGKAARGIKPSSKDTVIELCEYDSSKFTLIMCVLIGRAGMDHRAIESSSKFNLKAISFSNFTVFIAWCFGIGVTKDTWTFRHGSAPPMIGREVSNDSFAMEPSGGFTPNLARRYLKKHLKVSQLTAVRNSIMFYDDTPENIRRSELLIELAFAGIFKKCYDINEKPLKPLKKKLKRMFDQHDLQKALGAAAR